MVVASLHLLLLHLSAALSFFVHIAISQTPTPSPTPPSQLSQPILHPSGDDVVVAGSTFTIQWTPNTAFSNITLELWDKTSWGYSRDFGSLCYHWVNPFCGTIASHAPNTGSYEWHVPHPGSDFPREQRVFWIKMYVDDFVKESIGNTDPVLSYSQNFAFAAETGQANLSSSTTDIAAMTTSMRDSPGTVFVTVHDGSSSTRASPSRGTAASMEASVTPSATGNNTTLAKPSQGRGSRLHKAIPAVLILLLGLN